MAHTMHRAAGRSLACERYGAELRREALLLVAGRDQFRISPAFQWGGKDSNLRPTDYESRRKPSMEPNLAR